MQTIKDALIPTPAALRDERGRLLPGTPAMNPGGRPKGISAFVRELIGHNGEEALEMLAAIMRGEHGARSRERVDAAKTLLERGWGKAIEIQALTNLDTSDESTRQIASEALMKLAGALQSKPIPPKQITIDSASSDGSSAVAETPSTDKEP